MDDARWNGAAPACPVTVQLGEVTLTCQWDAGHIGAANGLHFDAVTDRPWHEPTHPAVVRSTTNASAAAGPPSP